MSQFDLHGKVAVVTGAGRGIGRGIALGLAAAGADLVLAARSADELDAAGQEVENLGAQSLAVPTDVADLDSLAALFERTTERFGGVDILVNNAGVGRRSDFLDITPEMWDYVHDINLRSVCFAMQHGIRSMLERGYGRVINIASLTTYIGMPGNSIYGASKGGVGQLTKAVATEMGPSGVTVNAIAPGFIHTDINDRMYQKPEFNAWVRSRIPMGEWGAPEDIAGTAVYLASPASAYVTGQIIPVDGGWLGA
jgi:2-dehydro-3-deoxy-D-gluconate 5-dehydrogenase